MYDLVIKGGRVVDGTGSPWYVADVGVSEGRIARVGTIEDTEATRVVQAAGLVVAPGFVDIHSHADFVLPSANHMDVLSPLMLPGHHHSGHRQLRSFSGATRPRQPAVTC